MKFGWNFNSPVPRYNNRYYSLSVYFEEEKRVCDLVVIFDRAGEDFYRRKVRACNVFKRDLLFGISPKSKWRQREMKVESLHGKRSLEALATASHSSTLKPALLGNRASYVYDAYLWIVVIVVVDDVTVVAVLKVPLLLSDEERHRLNVVLIFRLRKLGKRKLEIELLFFRHSS